ncbi:ATP phosphoribosyltransferase regulatory subunit [Lentilactobacillus fungorum]|uniref:ATP phosphoribosyltransferase regulatory subunit n=1 Tax=Lentilactobacillus fungorum TaxID=2201250 RepID=A0ABQ3W1F6_9LACO|nr:ATP phosphoribosyltransferase regulatory subunit [Lentilactobacillus fungorum]GHP15020.1 ATP phosphoribosyltransferase regulatory subunit [Lentilactobacillus fungorum]
MKNKNLPNGTRDELGVQAEAKEVVENQLFQSFRRRGFRKLTTPVLEYQDVFKPLNQNHYRPYQLLDDQGETLVLRPDLTLPVARVMSTTGIELPVKWYYGGDVFRLKKQLSGSYNQLTQAGVEIVGYGGMKADWECLTVALSGCHELNIQSVVVELSQATFVDTVMAQLPLPSPTKVTLKTALYAKDLSRYNHLWAPLKGSEYAPFLSEWPWLFGNFDDILALVNTLPKAPRITKLVDQLTATRSFIAQQFPRVDTTLDLSVPSPQAYYTGMTFRGFTASSADYLFSGGRYDDLLTNFQKVPVAAVGVAFDIDALVQRQPLRKPDAPVLIYFENDQWPQAEQLLAGLPNATLCLVDNQAAAEALAASSGSQLIDLTKSR